MRDSQYLVLVTIPDESSLIALSSRAISAGLDVLTWHEPDMADQATAVAIEPGKVAQRLCSSLPLLGKPLLAATG